MTTDFCSNFVHWIFITWELLFWNKKGGAHAHLSAHSIKNFFLSGSSCHPMDFCKRKIWFGQNEIFFRPLKKCSNLPPFWSTICTSLPLVLNELWLRLRNTWCDFRLDSSCLFYVCKFNLVVHTTCWKGAFCMDYKAKFTEAKQAR